MPPLMNQQEPIWAFERMICVSLGLEYERRQFVRGFPMPTFTKNLKHFAANKAYCRRNGSCPIEGTLDLFNCMGVPIVATLPHFLDADPSLLENVESGLDPKKRDHEIMASVDLVSKTDNECQFTSLELISFLQFSRKLAFHFLV